MRRDEPLIRQHPPRLTRLRWLAGVLILPLACAGQPAAIQARKAPASAASGPAAADPGTSAAAPTDSTRGGPDRTDDPTTGPARPSRPGDEAAPATTPSPKPTRKAADTPVPPTESKKTKTVLDFSDITIEGDLVRPDAGRITSGDAWAGPVPSSKPRADPRPRPRSSTVQAGAADDNLQYSAFLKFLDENARPQTRPDRGERLIVSVLDRAGLPVPGAQVELRDGQRTTKKITFADGRTLLYPVGDQAEVAVRYGDLRVVQAVPHGRHRLAFTLPTQRRVQRTVPLDIAFILDTTGSMDDEIAQLKATLEVIHFQITHLSPRPDVRFSMVLYRDEGDDYVVRKVPFTSDVEAFRQTLDRVRTGGGGDYPEAVQAALRTAVDGLKWRDDGVRIGFLIGDAPPHLDGEISFLDTMERASGRGVKLAAIGASGLSIDGEVVWRQIAQATMSPFVFLTYGERGDAEGTPSTVSHHVGSNWAADNLDAIVVRMVKVELAHYAADGAPPREDYFSAIINDAAGADAVLDELFARSVKQLTDYSVEQIGARTPTVVLPASLDTKGARPFAGGIASKLARRLELALSGSGNFQLIEGERLGALAEATASQMSARYDSTKMVEVGKLVPAQLAILTQLAERQDGKPMEMLVKLVRLQTGEVLSLSLLKIDMKLVM